MPRPEVVKRALDQIRKGGANYKHFFSQLSSPAWIEPLSQEGLFKEPPTLVRQGDWTSYPSWPESEYLARMAPLAAETVLGVLEKLPYTDNLQVHADLFRAASEMPAELASKLVPKMVKWVEAVSWYGVLGVDDAGALLGHLARGGEVERALELARALLAVFPGEDAKEQGDVLVRTAPEVQGRFDIWAYERLLSEHFPSVARGAGIAALALLCELLEEAVRLSLAEEERTPPRDHSHIWRPAIEDHDQNLGHSIKDALVVAVRDSAEQLADDKASSVGEVVVMLEARAWWVFRRIALHLLRLHAQEARELVAARLTNRTLFDEVGVQHEYALLAASCFGDLTREDQATILRWIEEGPDADRFREAQKSRTAQEPTDEPVMRYANAWRRDKLAVIHEALPDEWQRRYEQLVAEVGRPPAHPEFPAYMEMFAGPTSPVEAAELSAMSVEEVVRYLREWEGSRGPLGPSPQGLGRVLRGVVAAQPERYAAEAQRFERLQPTYVRQLLEGLRSACKGGRAFEWGPVLRLCTWVLEQPETDEAEEGVGREADPGWGWSRQAVASLVKAGLGQGASEVPFELRDLVWGAVHALSSDRDPSPEHDARPGQDYRDPYTAAINSTRGEAMHAVVEYGLWCRRHLREGRTGSDEGAATLREMPEVEEILTRRLDPEIEPSAAVRAVYGRLLPWLYLLSGEWLEANLPRIFPGANEWRHLREAAWGAYVIFNRPYHDVFPVMRGEYTAAIERLGEETLYRWGTTDPERRLAEHVMWLYWQGRVELDDSLVVDLFGRGNTQVRAAALSFVGRSLEGRERPVPADVGQRLCRLYEWRLQVVRQGQPDDDVREELRPFGWWFASGQLQEEWALPRLETTLELTGGVVDRESRVVERLASMAGEYPREVVRCLRRMIPAAQEPWRLYAWREDVRVALHAALASEDHEARDEAELLRDEWLVRRPEDHSELRDGGRRT